MRFVTLFALLLLLSTFQARAEEPVFSGPQVGEPLPQFEAQVVFGKEAGAKVKVLDEKAPPTILIFSHQVTRPSIGLIRLLMNYAKTKQKEGLQTRLVFLTSDPTETEAWFRRARHALPKGASPLISLDGIEGPGAYGLNRKVTITALVSNKGTVTANFALIQPSIQADAPKIGHAIVKALGGKKAPTLKEMGFVNRRMGIAKKPGKGQLTPEQQTTYRRMIAPVIRSKAEDVTAAAKKVEEFAAKTPWFKTKVHDASNMIINGGKLANYGTKEAQDYLKKWSVEFAPPKPARAKPGGLKAKAAAAKEEAEKSSGDISETKSSADSSTDDQQ